MSKNFKEILIVTNVFDDGVVPLCRCRMYMMLQRKSGLLFK